MHEVLYLKFIASSLLKNKISTPKNSQSIHLWEISDRMKHTD